MAVLAVAAAGAWAGSAAFGAGALLWGMTGAQLGWMAGSMLGNAMFAPTQKSQGPKLNDLTVSGSAYGQPIPWVAGSPRISGQVVWASAKREIATTQSAGGKGGGGSEYTSYTYEVDLLILLTDNEIAGVSRIWSNGELVYDGTAKAGLWSRMTVYTGAASQLPDPTYEAAVGSANAPAYRGRGSVFIQSLQLGSGGQIPNLTFEIGLATSAVVTTDGLLCHFDEVTSDGYNYVSEIGPNIPRNPDPYVEPDPWPTENEIANAVFGGYGSNGEHVVDGITGRINRSWRIEANVQPLTSGGISSIQIELRTTLDEAPRLLLFFNQALSYRYDSFEMRAANGTYDTGVVRVATGATAVEEMGGPVAYDGPFHIAVQYDHASGTTSAYCRGELFYTYPIPANFWDSSPYDFNEIYIIGPLDEVYYSFPTAGHLVVTPPPFAHVPGGAASSPLLPEVVTALMLRAGYSAPQFDVTALSSAKLVRALANGSVSTARTLLEMLASTYQFEAVLADKIYFRPRGGAPVATITFDELGVMQDSTNVADPLPLTIANELEIPAQMALTYNNVDGDYQTDTQYSDRLLTGMESTSAVQVPMGFTASEAKAIADTSLMDKAVSALSTTVKVGIEYAKLEPTDVILLTGEDTSQYRMRIIKRTDAGGVTTLQCVGDDASVLTQAGVTDTAASGQTTVAALATTTLELMDLPALRDVDNLPGLYVAVTGSATNWTSAAVYDSLDDITYTTQSLITSQAPLGTCSTALGNWAGGNVFDETNTVTVDVGLQQLASVTYSDILANTATNAALVGNELIQYRVATLVSAGVYTLSGLLRGRRGTEDAMTGHVAAERFVALGISGVRFLPLQSGDLARLRYYKGVSASQALSAVTAQSITPVGNTLKPFAPVHPRANRDAADTVISWTRQTRLSTRIVGALPPSIPLGETAESYEVEIWDSGYTTLKRTLASSTQTVTYTNAQQVTDFGSAQVTLYVKIYQLSATVGRGKPLTASI